MTMAKRPRTERRALARELAKMARDKDKLARLSPGGAPERAIELASASQVETHARSVPCPLCEGPLRVDAHTAETIDGLRVRVAQVTCTRCGVHRSLYFRLAAPN